MKSIHVALALASSVAACTAAAQTSVQLYGLVDSGLAHITNADADGNSVTKVPSLTGSLPSRIGFRGTEELGNGLQAFFVLENGLSMDTGAVGQGGRLFGRAANVGLKGSWGTFTVGRQNNMTYLAAMKSDVMGPHLFSMSSIDLYIPNARSDNALGYLGNFNGVVVGGTYSFGRDGASAGGPAATNCPGEVAGNAKACRQYTALLGYESTGWGLNATYDRIYGNAGAAGGLASSDNTDIRTTVNAYAMLGATRIGAGLMDRETNAVTGLAESVMVYLGASLPIGALTLDAQVATRNARRSSDDVTLYVARLTYALSKRTAVYASVGRMDNDGASAVALDAGGTVAPGMSQNGVILGMRHAF